MVKNKLLTWVTGWAASGDFNLHLAFLLFVTDQTCANDGPKEVIDKLRTQYPWLTEEDIGKTKTVVERKANKDAKKLESDKAHFKDAQLQG